MWFYHTVKSTEGADGKTKSVDPDLSAPSGAVLSGSTLFTKTFLIICYHVSHHMTKPTKWPIHPGKTCALNGYPRTQAFFMWTSKNSDQTGHWSESLLGTQVILLVLSCGSSWLFSWQVHTHLSISCLFSTQVLIVLFLPNESSLNRITSVFQMFWDGTVSSSRSFHILDSNLCHLYVETKVLYILSL